MDEVRNFSYMKSMYKRKIKTLEFKTKLNLSINKIKDENEKMSIEIKNMHKKLKQKDKLIVKYKKKKSKRSNELEKLIFCNPGSKTVLASPDDSFSNENSNDISTESIDNDETDSNILARKLSDFRAKNEEITLLNIELNTDKLSLEQNNTKLTSELNDLKTSNVEISREKVLLEKNNTKLSSELNDLKTFEISREKELLKSLKMKLSKELNDLKNHGISNENTVLLTSGDNYSIEKITNQYRLEIKHLKILNMLDVSKNQTLMQENFLLEKSNTQLSSELNDLKKNSEYEKLKTLNVELMQDKILLEKSNTQLSSDLNDLKKKSEYEKLLLEKSNTQQLVELNDWKQKFETANKHSVNTIGKKGQSELLNENLKLRSDAQMVKMIYKRMLSSLDGIESDGMEIDEKCSKQRKLLQEFVDTEQY